MCRSSKIDTQIRIQVMQHCYQHPRVAHHHLLPSWSDSWYGLMVRAKALPCWSKGMSVPLPSRLLVRANVSTIQPL